LGCKNSVIPDTVTYICEGAFTGVTELTEITIPDSVQGIETYAFSRCTGLKSVVLPESLKEIGSYAFNASGLEHVVINCGDCAMGSSVFSASKLRKIEFGENVKEISKSAFFNCTELTEVTIPGNVKTIGESAFNGCSKLVSLTLCEGITEIGYKAFFGCVGIKEIVIPDSVEKIDDYAFAHGKAEGSDPMLTYLKKVTLGKGLQYIGEQAFARCSALEEVVINCENLNHIGERAFHSCYSLKDIDLPDSLTKIEYAAFAACRSFKNVVIPDSVTEIGKSAFRACTSLESVTFGSNLKTIGETAFADCTNLRSVVLPDGLKTINRKAFDNCRISKLSMPDNVTYLGLNAFKGNSIISVENDIDGVYYLGNEKNPYAVFVGVKNTSYIKSIEIKEGTKLIAEGAFEDCYELETLTIPESVLNINGIAFLSCRSLKTVYYAGNKRQWKNINISDVLNDELFAAVFAGDFAIETEFNFFTDNAVLVHDLVVDSAFAISDSFESVGISGIVSDSGSKNILCKFNEVSVFSHKVGFAIERNDICFFAIGRNTTEYATFLSVTLGAFRSDFLSFFSEDVDSGIKVAVAFHEGFFAVHHTCAGHAAEFHNLSSFNFSHFNNDLWS
ncbi:MAG: leucine-rich repeat protein, partial [Clostridia bacterium]|nr:leucine-rich repeat protein [Clostridia bacterium]